MKCGMIFLLVALPVLTWSCSATEKKNTKHPDLAGFSDPTLPAEPGTAAYDSLLTELGKNNMSVFNTNGILDISFLAEVNACGNYEGNIDIKNDTLKLLYIQTNDLVCTSVEMKKLHYLVYNPSGKKYIIRNTLRQ